MTTTTHHAVAVAILALTLSSSPASAGVTYHLDTGLPPGTGMYAQMEINSPPASATSGWSANLGYPGFGTFGIEMTVFNLVVPVPNGVSAVEYTTGPGGGPEGTIGSATGATLDVGAVFGYGWAERQLAAIVFDFGPGGAGDVDAVFNDRPFGQAHGTSGVEHVVAHGTWVLGAAPPPVPEPTSALLLLIGLASAAAWPHGGGG